MTAKEEASTCQMNMSAQIKLLKRYGLVRQINIISNVLIWFSFKIQIKKSINNQNILKTEPISQYFYTWLRRKIWLEFQDNYVFSGFRWKFMTLKRFTIETQFSFVYSHVWRHSSSSGTTVTGLPMVTPFGLENFPIPRVPWGERGGGEEPRISAVARTFLFKPSAVWKY